MKKTRFMGLICALALLVAAVTFSACAEENGNAPQNPAIILAGNPTTGYTWVAQIEDESIVSVVDDGFATDETDEAVVGAGGYSRFELVGVAEGYTTVTFVYARSWEDEAPVYSLEYDVSVDADLKVTIVSTTFLTGES